MLKKDATKVNKHEMFRFTVDYFGFLIKNIKTKKSSCYNCMLSL